MSEIYGEHAVTGTAEDAAAGKQIEFIDNGTKETIIPTKGGEKEPPDKEGAEGGETPEEGGEPKEPSGDEKNTALKKEVEKHEETVQEIEASLTAKGVDFAAVKAEFDEAGELSEDTYEKLAKAGYPKNAADMMIAGMQAIAERFAGAVYEHVGGKKQFEGIQKFVKAQGAKEVEVFNRVMSSKDIDQVSMFLDGVKAQMALKHGTSPQLSLGGQQVKPDVQGYRSKAEMVAAMSDPRYHKDAAYRADVQEK